MRRVLGLFEEGFYGVNLSYKLMLVEIEYADLYIISILIHLQRADSSRFSFAGLRWNVLIGSF